MQLGSKLAGQFKERKDHGEAMLGSLTNSFVAFDLEATGLSLATDRLVEVGAIRFVQGGTITSTFQRLVNPQQPSSPRARTLHGLADDLLDQAASAAVILPEFVAFLGDPAATTLVAHNAAFDTGLLGHELIRAGMDLPGHYAIDTLAWARRRWPEMRSHKLDHLARRAGIEGPSPHRALADSDRVRRVFLALAEDDPFPDGREPLAYPFHVGGRSTPIPRGWGPVAAASAHGGAIRVVYAGGSHGPDPRDLTPLRFEHRGGTAFLVAVCHLDWKTKEFHLDRMHSVELLGSDHDGGGTRG